LKNTKSYKSFIKSPYKSIKHNTYFELYDHFFNKYRKKKITFVEIGVLNGGSLFMWRDYFGSKARIIGIDLNPDAKKWEKYGFEIFIGNQSDKNFWAKFIKKIGNIDIVLDDGGHTYEQQITTVESLINHINNNGIIVTEDTHTSYMSGYGPKSKSFIKYTNLLIDRINMRFKKFENKKSEKRIWTIEIAESMVAFRRNTNASYLISKAADNNKKDFKAVDFKYADNKAILLSEKIGNFLWPLRYLPFSKYFSKLIRKKLGNRKFNANEYFK